MSTTRRVRRVPLAAAVATVALGTGIGAISSAILSPEPGATNAVATAAAAARPIATSTPGLTVNQIYQNEKQGVVDIQASTQSTAVDPFGTPQGGATQVEGSGFVIDKSGDIVTNQHVVDGAGSITVKFADGTSAAAKVVGQDATSDVAVIRVSVDSSKLQPLAFADSSKVQVGDGVVAIGSPYGLSGSVTSGIISALGRSIKSPNNYTITGALQTDAPINHGNSGGPLLDSSGRVIGINSQIDSSSGDNSGVGFAVPSATVQRVVSQLISSGSVQHAYLGVRLTDGSGGASVAAVTSGSPASSAGLANGDLVTAASGNRVTSASDLIAAVSAARPGQKLALSVVRSGATRSVTVTLATQPA